LNIGAVYVTSNGGLNWKAQVKETIDATLNRVSSSGTSGASFFTGKIATQVGAAFYDGYSVSTGRYLDNMPIHAALDWVRFGTRQGTISPSLPEAISS